MLSARGADGVGAPEITDLERRAADTVKTGRVIEADYPKARLRVGIGDPADPEGYIKTGWLPMAQSVSGEWSPIKVGEAVVVLSEGGELQNGVVMRAAINNTDKPAVGDRGDLWRRKFDDGSVIEHDEAAGAFKIDVKTKIVLKVGDATITVQDGSIVLAAGGQTLTIGSGGAASSGKIKGEDGLEVTGGTFTHDGKNVGKDHHHLGVVPGGGLSGDPV